MPNQPVSSSQSHLWEPSDIYHERFTIEPNHLERAISVHGNTGIAKADIDNSHDLEPVDAFDYSYLRGKVKHPARPDRSTPIRIADVFCGAGGLSLGLDMAVKSLGLRPEYTLAVDQNPTALEVYRHNFKPHVYSSDNLWSSVTTGHSRDPIDTHFTSAPQIIKDSITEAAGRVDILVGGPPCEGHSNHNNHTRHEDPRNKLYLVMPAMAAALGAKAVIVENVPAIRHDREQVLAVAKRLFASEGYYVTEHIADMTSLGIPQTRRRHILVATRGRYSALLEAFQAFQRPSRPLSWAIGDLVGISPNNIMDLPADLSEENKQRIKHMFENNLYEMPNTIRPPSHKGNHTYPSVYGRLRWEAPSGTVTTGYSTPGRGRYIHPSIQRTITAHEAARIQGFPDNFEFRTLAGDMANRSAIASMIGDAVPPQLGFVAGMAALESILE